MMDEGKNVFKWTIISAVSICGGIILGSTYKFIIDIINNEFASSSDLGNFLGGYVGAILSILTVVLLWLTYSTQNEKFDKQLSEQKNQLIELKKQTKENKNNAIWERLSKEVEFITNLIDKFETKEKNLLQLSQDYRSNRISSIPLLKDGGNTKKRISETHLKNYFSTVRFINSCYVSIVIIDNRWFTPIEKHLFVPDAISKIPIDFFVLITEFSLYLKELKECEFKFEINENEFNEQIRRIDYLLELFDAYHFDKDSLKEEKK